jgi:hypothetical protein
VFDNIDGVTITNSNVVQTPTSTISPSNIQAEISTSTEKDQPSINSSLHDSTKVIIMIFIRLQKID